jgi:methylated-DNA-[protein]-cysteine S-methyltransferase
MTQELSYVVFKTASGWVGVLGSSAGLRRTTLPQHSEKEAIKSLGVDISGATLSAHPFEDLIKRFHTFFSGQKTDFPDELDLSEATPFQRSIWQAARHIPFGQTRSYAWVAREAGKPGAARAAGQALGKNHLPIIVPCHRVISSGGGLGGFSGGLAMKEFLLKLEKSAIT